MRWSDLALTLLGEGAIHGLPPEGGVIQMFLDPQTKTDRTKITDIIVTWTTGRSGLSLGKWIKRIMDLLELNVQDLAFNNDFIFMHPGGSQWTSAFFRSTHLWPSLNEQHLAGDPHLQPYDGSPGNTLMEKFWSMHCYQRGGCTQVSKRRPFCVRPATDSEVFEHGRWRRTHQSLTMDKAYLEWLICDRTAITLLYMYNEEGEFIETIEVREGILLAACGELHHWNCRNYSTMGTHPTVSLRTTSNRCPSLLLGLG